jgi:hypothetical protein
MINKIFIFNNKIYGLKKVYYKNYITIIGYFNGILNGIWKEYYFKNIKYYELYKNNKYVKTIL